MDFEAFLVKIKAMPWFGQWRLLAGAGFLAMGAIALLVWGFTPEYAPLFTSLAEKDGGAVMANLEQNGYAYKLSSNGVILVERNKIFEARFKLAAAGLPKTTADESNSAPKFGASNAQEQAYQQKTKEVELARTINGISGISGARVHLAIPHQTVFGKESTPPTASVVLDSTNSISRSQAAAIAHLVANATPGLKTSDVSIIDGHGKLLTQDGQDTGDTPEQRAYTKELQADLQSRVERLLIPLVGKDGAKAEIDVALEFGNEEAVTESWKPNSGEAAIRSQQSGDARQGGASASGIPGSATNTVPLALPPLPGQSQSTPAKTESTSGTSHSITNYELDRSVVKSIKKGVKIKKIRAAVLVDFKHSIGKDGKSTSIPMPPADLSKIQALVQESIGIDEDRGDSIQVINMQFVANAATEDPALPAWKDPYYVELGLLGLKWAAILGTMLWLVRSARNMFTLVAAQSEDKPKEENSSTTENTESQQGDGSVPIVAKPDGAQPVDLANIKQVAQSNPQAVASVIKGWVEGDGNE